MTTEYYDTAGTAGSAAYQEHYESIHVGGAWQQFTVDYDSDGAEVYADQSLDVFLLMPEDINDES
jgi:hypothetical protein